MPPKAAAAKKEEPEKKGPFDDLEYPKALREKAVELRTTVEALVKERNQVQADRDATDNFFGVTKKDLQDVELQLLALDREMEVMADNHRVELKVYQQKVKHLEFEHANTASSVRASNTAAAESETDLHLRRETALRMEKQALRSQIRQTEEANADAIRTMKLMQEKAQFKLRQEFAANLEALRAKFEKRLGVLRDDLTLRHRVEVHEVEERKNLHINQLMKAHEEAFAEIKKYYNDITKANLELIQTLKAQIAEANEKQSANQKLMLEIAEENKRLSDPLAKATAELASLQADLKDADKDRQSLAYARSRFKALQSQIASLEGAHTSLEQRYAEVEAERDELYAKFEATVRMVKERSEAKNEVLEKRLSEAEAEFASKRAMIDDVLVSAQLDPHVLSAISAKLDAVLEGRNAMLRDLQTSITKLTKAHNDSVRVFEARLRELGLPQTAVTGLTMAGTATGFIVSAATTGPAGLVAKPTIP